jgi:DNA-binding transcriptional regulator YiaG
MDRKTIRKARKQAGESQAEFAARFGVDQATLSRWEKFGVSDKGTARKLVELVLAQLNGAATGPVPKR